MSFADIRYFPRCYEHHRPFIRLREWALFDNLITGFNYYQLRHVPPKRVWPANNGHESLRPAPFLMPASLLIANLFPALECPSNSLCFDKVISV